MTSVRDPGAGLSEDVRVVVRDLREEATIFCDIEKLMTQWDNWRKWIKEGSHGSLPSDGFLSLIDEVGEICKRGADTIERLSRALAEDDAVIKSYVADDLELTEAEVRRIEREAMERYAARQKEEK